MARAANDTMMNPPIEELLDRVDSKFALVTLAAKRARQINSYFNHLGDGLGSMVPPQVTSVARKPLSIGFEEIAADKIAYERPEIVEVDVVRARGHRGRRRGRRLTPRASTVHRPVTVLAGRRIVLGVTGGIAAYKAIEVCRRLVDAGAHVAPVLTNGAAALRGPHHLRRAGVGAGPTPPCSTTPTRSRTPASGSPPISSWWCRPPPG